MSSPRQQGLTLLEVLAAFLIFSMVFTILVGSSQSGVRSQGVSTRLLAAAEVADLVIADLEIPMARHELPVIEANEYPLEDFTVRIQERSFLGDDAATGPDAVGIPAMGDVASLLQTQLPDVGKYLVRYDIEVEWLEGNEPRSVERTTFAFDWAAAQVDTSGIFGGGGAGSDPTRGDRDDADEADAESSPDGEPGAGDPRSRSREGGGGPSDAETREILEKMRPYL
jgi:hypothetical protein